MIVLELILLILNLIEKNIMYIKSQIEFIESKSQKIDLLLLLCNINYFYFLFKISFNLIFLYIKYIFIFNIGLFI